MIFNRIERNRPLMRKNIFRLIFVGLSMACVNAQAAVDTSKQIDTGVRKAAQKEISEIAQHQGFGKYALQLDVVIPPEAASLAPCPKTPAVAPGANSKRTLYRLRYEVTCPGVQDWKLNVAVKTAITLPVITAVNALERGRVIDAQDVVLRPQDIAPLNGQFFTAPQEVIGQIVKRRVSESQIITGSLLEQPVIVERGQSVLMVASHQGIEASTTGEAMKQGRKGEVIRVRNISSQRTVDAIVVAPGEVRILTPTR